MITITIITTFLIVYLLSCRGAYKYIQKSYYHTNGQWNGQQPEAREKTLVFLPLMNSFLAIGFLAGNWKDGTSFFKP